MTGVCRSTLYICMKPRHISTWNVMFVSIILHGCWINLSGTNIFYSQVGCLPDTFQFTLSKSHSSRANLKMTRALQIETEVGPKNTLCKIYGHINTVHIQVPSLASCIYILSPGIVDPLKILLVPRRRNCSRRHWQRNQAIAADPFAQAALLYSAGICVSVGRGLGLGGRRRNRWQAWPTASHEWTKHGVIHTTLTDAKSPVILFSCIDDGAI